MWLSGVAVATWLVRLAGVYVGLGAFFAVPFVFWGAGRIDPDAREGTLGFKLLILPGAIALWPLLARRVLSGVSNPPEEKNEHRSKANL